MSNRLKGKSIFYIAALIFVLCVSFASPVSAAATRPVPGNATGLVVTTNWMADAVGQMILDSGGNAMDAAAAVGYALAVVHPTAGNIGGGGFAVIHTASGDTYALDFREMAPAAASRLMYVDTDHISFDINDPATYRARHYINPVTSADGGVASLYGYLAAGVPGSVAGFNEIVRRFGTKPLAEIMEPAIKMAENGFRLTAGTASSLTSSRTNFNQYDGSKKYFTKNGDGTGSFAEGDLFVQSDLAKTLKRIAANGSDGFYKGETADLIVADMVKYGGIITHQDLENYKFVWREPAQGTYRGYKIFSMSPPSSGGTHIVQMLNTIANEDIGELGFNSKRTVWLMTEAMRYAYADRSEYMGDPDYVNVPVADLTSKDYGKKIYDKIIAYGEYKARPSIEINPGLGPLHEGNETTHFSVVDSFGNAVGITYTINMGYGCRVAVDGAGFFMNDEMDDFMTVPGQPNGFGLIQGEANCVEPGKRPLSSMSPTIVLREADDSIFLVTGSPGGSQIITTVLNTVVNAIDHGMNVSELTAAPRFHMQWMPDTLTREALFGFTNDNIDSLRSMGYNLATTATIGDVDAIMSGARTGAGRALTGAHDPRTFNAPPTVALDLGPEVQGLADYWAVSSITVTPASHTLGSGEFVVLAAAIDPVYATNKNVAWTTSDNTLATVNSGVVIANNTGKAGTVTIKAIAEGNVSADSVITIQPVNATGIALNKYSITLLSGASETLTATITPDNTTDKDITWTTSDSTVATVTSGTITANTTKAGIALITATIGSVSVSCSVTVNALVPPGGGSVTLPGGTTANLPGGTVTNPNGTIILPSNEGGTITTPGGLEIDIPGGTEIGPDGTILIPSDKDGTLKLSGAQANLPGGTVIWPDGTIKLPQDKGSALTGSDGVAVEFPGGSLLWPDGTLAVPPGKAISILTSDSLVSIEVLGNIMLEPDGTVTLLGSVAIETSNGTMIEFADGTITEEMDARGDMCLYIALEGKSGTVTYPDGKTVTISSGSIVKVNPDGSINITGGKGGGGGGCNVGFAFFTVLALGAMLVFGSKKI